MSERIGIAGGGAIASRPRGRRGRARARSCSGRAARSAATAKVERADREARRPGRRQRVGHPRPRRRCATRRSSSRRSSRSTTPRRALLRRARRRRDDGAILATTTSALSVSALGARRAGRPERFVGLHVFNPVPKMDAGRARVPAEAADADTRERARALCAALGKTAVEVPDTPGFVVNRLLFPFLFDAVRLLERTGLDAEAIDTCMRLGRRPPDGPARAARPRRARRRRRRSARTIGADGPRARRGADRRGRARPQGRARLPHVLRHRSNV